MILPVVVTVVLLAPVPPSTLFLGTPISTRSSSAHALARMGRACACSRSTPVIIVAPSQCCHGLAARLALAIVVIAAAASSSSASAEFIARDRPPAPALSVVPDRRFRAVTLALGERTCSSLRCTRRAERSGGASRPELGDRRSSPPAGSCSASTGRQTSSPALLAIIGGRQERFVEAPPFGGRAARSRRGGAAQPVARPTPASQ
jgi:hypothetical protein